MVDDELISAYIDGQLSSTEQAALEARMGQDPTLRQQVALTQLLVSETRQLSAPVLPRHFALPNAYVRPAQRNRWGWDGRWLFRATSLLSAGLCAVLFAIDAGQWAGRNAQPQQAVARTMTPITETLPQSSGAGTLPPTVVIQSIAATLPNATLTDQPQQTAPETMAKAVRSLSVETYAATPIATLPIVNSPEPTATPLIQTPQTPLAIPTVPNAEPFPVSLLPQALAALAGLAALFFAGLGWRQR